MVNPHPSTKTFSKKFSEKNYDWNPFMTMIVLSQHYRRPAVVVGSYTDSIEAELVREVVARADYTAMVWIIKV